MREGLRETREGITSGVWREMKPEVWNKRVMAKGW